MQKISTRIFICASVAFGVIGILMVLVGGPDGNGALLWNQRLHQLLLITVCIILPSFALSIASKYFKQ